jgi:MFS-type transporter involved in bile tolerance (Atg22 family)
MFKKYTHKKSDSSNYSFRYHRYPVAVIYGFVLGGFSSFCRALFGELVPPGFEAAFYALYAITDKGSSVFGPAIVGAITDATGEIRPVSNHDFLHLASSHSLFFRH